MRRRNIRDQSSQLSTYHHVVIQVVSVDLYNTEVRRQGARQGSRGSIKQQAKVGHKISSNRVGGRLSSTTGIARQTDKRTC